MLFISPQLLGRGFVQLAAGEPLKTGDQFFDYQSSEWRMSTYYTAERMTNKGKVPYRRAVSLGAKLTSVWPLIKKYWRRYLQ